ncbi:MAG: hypothetical protein L3J88_03370 [Gammaproteobacteria bacterium]|nr:hypothetical protein [Gammaproteobacteria bacterium]MCF6362391.1 hypothetical protein [Gammaproteobacteria bacterium]
MNLTRLMAIIGFTVALLLSSGCATVYTQHPTLADKAGPDVASVYFIRTVPVYTNDFADAPVIIEFQDKKLLKLGEGAYTLLYLKPAKGELKVSNNTLYTNQLNSQRVWKERHYRFIGGRTYFIHIQQIDEEFRGIFYEPELVSLQQAKQLIKHLRRMGAKAAAHPIDKLTHVAAPPESAAKDKKPTLPESLYKSTPYMLDEK